MADYKKLIKRILSVFFWFPIFMLTVYSRSWVPFMILIPTTVLICLLEFYSIVEKKGIKPFVSWGVVIGLLFVGSAYVEHQQNFSIMTDVLTVSVILIFVLQVFKKGDCRGVIANVSVTLLGALYVGWLFSYSIKMSFLSGGRRYFLFLLCVVWSVDILSFVVGKTLGKHKLIPRISPKKTIEGAIGGLLGAVAIGFLVRAVAGLTLYIGIKDCLILGILIGIAAQVGDLCESLLKRDAGVKDSGYVIPGHGGMLDSFDSLIFSAPVMYYYLKFFVER